MNVGKSRELALESMASGDCTVLFEGVVTVRTSCFDTHFISQSKLTEFPLIHCFVTRLDDNTFVKNLSIILDYYKYNHCREGIRIANARPKVIIFCKSHPSNCIYKGDDNNKA